MNKNKKTIFISIAAMDDQELEHTINYAFSNAEFPERIFVGVGLTAMTTNIVNKLKKISKKNSNVSFKYTKQKKNNISTLGIGLGRTSAASLYDDQDYMIQIDCHSFFKKSWDSYLIELFEESCKVADSKKVVMTGIPPSYRYCCDKHNEPIPSGAETRYPFYESSSFFVHVIPKWSEVNILDHLDEKFLPVIKVSPAFIMGNRWFGKNPGIHQEAIFYDEDLTQSTNLFSRGFSFVFPNVSDLPVLHLDSNGIVKGHDRYFFLDYLNEEKNKKIHEELKERYLNFVKSSKNKKAVSEYFKYAKIHPIKGCFTLNQNLVPESFR